MSEPKPYEKPAIIQSEPMDVKAVVCNRTNSSCSTVQT